MAQALVPQMSWRLDAAADFGGPRRITLRDAASRAICLFGSRADEQLLRRHGLDRIEPLIAQAPSVEGRHSDRRAWPIDIRDERGVTQRLYVKVHWNHLRAVPRLKDIPRGQFFDSMPEREWNGLLTFRSLGLAAAEPVCVMRDGLFRANAAVFTRAVPPTDSFHDWLATGRWSRLPRSTQLDILDEMWRVIARVYGAGLRWLSLQTKHLYPEQRPDGRWRVWLIDCEGVQRRITARDIRLDLKRLINSLSWGNADEWTRSAFQKRAAAFQQPHADEHTILAMELGNDPAPVGANRPMRRAA